MGENALLTAPVSKLKQLLVDRTVSSEELTKACLAQIAAENAKLNAVVTVCAEEALASARDADAQIARGTIKSLTGIPLLHKDIFCTRGVRTTCGSRMLENCPPMTPPWSPNEGSGCRHAWQCNMDEFAMGSSNETSGSRRTVGYELCTGRQLWRIGGGTCIGDGALVTGRHRRLYPSTSMLCGVTSTHLRRVSRLGISLPRP